MIHTTDIPRIIAEDFWYHGNRNYDELRIFNDYTNDFTDDVYTSDRKPIPELYESSKISTLEELIKTSWNEEDCQFDYEDIREFLSELSKERFKEDRDAGRYQHVLDVLNGKAPEDRYHNDKEPEIETFAYLFK